MWFRGGIVVGIGAVAAAKHVFSGGFPVQDGYAMRELLNGERAPGETSSDSPSAAILATEVDAVGEAFADALVDAQTQWTSRS